MNTVFTETLRGWQNFYFMMGGASAGLAGLMFVALSLGMNLVTEETKASIKVFATPSIFYFVSVLLLSGLMLVPTFSAVATGAILALGGLFGFIKTASVARHLFAVAREHQDFDVWEYLSQIILPTAAYTLILIAGICLFGSQWSLAFIGLWLATIFLLVCAISNTWSMVLWIIEKR